MAEEKNPITDSDVERILAKSLSGTKKSTKGTKKNTKALNDQEKALRKKIKALLESNKALEKQIKEIDKSSKAWVRNHRNTNKASLSLSVLRSKILIASFAIGGATRFITRFTNASKEQEGAVKRVSNVIASQGFISKVTTREVEALASSLQKTTGVTDELTLESSALLLSFQNIGSEIFPQAQKAVLDMTSALNGGKISAETLKTQSIQLAKALDDPVKGLNALRRAGTTFDKATQSQVKTLVKQGKILEAQKIILSAVNRQYGDTASIDSYEKSSRALSSAMGDLTEDIGDLFIPAVRRANELMTIFITSIKPSDIANTATAFTAVSIAVVLLNKRMRQAIFTSTLLTGGLTFLARATAGFAGVLGVKKLLDYVDTFESLKDTTNQYTDNITTAKEALGKFNLEALKGMKIFHENSIINTKILQEERKKDLKLKAFISGMDKEQMQDSINNDERLIAMTMIIIEHKRKISNLEDVIAGKESASFDIRKSNLEEILRKLREERVIFIQKDELTKKLTKSQIENGLITIDVSDASINAIEEEIRLMDELVNKAKAKKEIQNLSFKLASESAQALHEITMNQIGDINALEEAELKRIKNTSEYKLAVAKGDQDEVERLEKKARAKSYDARKKQYNADQALAYSNIAIGLAQGIMKAYSTYEFVSATVISGMLTAIAGVQASAVASAPPPEKYAMGGLVGGRRHSAGGTMIEAERGEFVMNRQAVKNFGVGNLNSMNSGSAPLNITFNNSVMSEDYTEDVIIPQIKRAIQRGADIGIA